MTIKQIVMTAWSYLGRTLQLTFLLVVLLVGGSGLFGLSTAGDIFKIGLVAWAVISLMTRWLGFRHKTASVVIWGLALFLYGSYAYLIIPFIPGSTDARNVFYNYFAVWRAEQNIGARQQLKAADATLNDHMGATKRNVTLFGDDGQRKSGLVAKGTKVLISYRQVPAEVSEAVMYRTVVYVVIPDDEGLPSGTEGWTLAANIDDFGPQPVAGLDSRGRCVPHSNVEEHTYSLGPHERTPTFIAWNHGDEYQAIAVTNDVDAKRRPFDACQSGACVPVLDYVKFRDDVPISYQAGSRGTTLKVTITTVTCGNKSQG